MQPVNRNQNAATGYEGRSAFVAETYDKKKAVLFAAIDETAKRACDAGDIERLASVLSRLDATIRFYQRSSDTT